MKKIVECVPNFSEGRDQTVINAIADAVRGVPGIKLMGVEPDKDYNRTVVTFAGDPEGAQEAAFRSAQKAAELIDMRTHKGEHPRLGAIDVVPFIPISGMTMSDCVRLAENFGKRVAEELKIPVYLYEQAARRPERMNLSDIRKGEYEGLPDKLQDPNWAPDFGEPVFNARSGGLVTGARKFLIAYNVNLATSDSKIADEIGQRIRESGKIVRDENGKARKNERGETIRIPGTLKAVKAMGVFLERFNIAQVSINLIDHEITPPHAAFEEVKRQARELGVEVTGSEIVGLTPLAALVMAAQFYHGGKPLPEYEAVALAIERLGLSQLEQFVPEKKIIEYQLSGGVT